MPGEAAADRDGAIGLPQQTVAECREPAHRRPVTIPPPIGLGANVGCDPAYQLGHAARVRGNAFGIMRPRRIAQDQEVAEIGRQMLQGAGNGQHQLIGVAAKVHDKALPFASDRRVAIEINVRRQDLGMEPLRLALVELPEHGHLLEPGLRRRRKRGRLLYQRHLSGNEGVLCLQPNPPSIATQGEAAKRAQNVRERRLGLARP